MVSCKGAHVETTIILACVHMPQRGYAASADEAGRVTVQSVGWAVG